MAEFQRGPENDMLRGPGVAPDAVQQQPGGRGPKLISGLRNGGERGMNYFRKVEVIETHDGDIFGALQTGITYRQQRAKSDQIVGRKNDGRPWNQTQ